MIQRVLSRGWICNYKKVSFLMIMGAKPKYCTIRLDFDATHGMCCLGGPWSFHHRTGASVVTPLPVLENIFKHREQCSLCSTKDNYYSQNILIINGSSCSCSSGSSSQVNTVRLRLMNAVPSPVSTMEHVLTYWGATRAGALQVCGNMTWNTCFLYSLWEWASVDLLNSSVANVAWSGRPGWLW